MFLFIFATVLYQGTAQTCLQKLDSAQYFKYSQREKANFYAQSLLSDLDSNRCNVDLGIAGLYNNLGLLLWDINERQKGREALIKGLNQQLMVQDSFDIDLLGICYNLSAIFQETGDFDQAKNFIVWAGKTVNQYVGYGEKEIRLSYLRRKGIFFRDIGEFEVSLVALQNAIETEEIPDSTRISLQIELGTTYRYAGNLEQSEIELLEAMQQAKGVSEEQYFAAIDRLSSLKMEQGEYSDSENYLLFNLKKREELSSGDPLSKLETLNGLGILYYKLNDLESAEKYISEALAAGGDIRNVRPYLVNNLGTIYLKQEKLDTAQQYFQESADGFKDLFGVINPDYASSMSNLAGVYKRQGDLGEALNLYTKVLDMDKVIFGKSHPRYATSLSNVALLYFDLGHFSLAGKLLFEAKKIREEILGSYHPSTIKTTNDLGIYYLVSKDTSKAIEMFDQALTAEIKHMQDIFPVLTDNQRQLYFEQARFNVERFCALAFTPRYIETSLAQDALNHFINTKGILFYASQKMRDVVQASGDKAVQKIYNDWRNKKYKLAQAYLLPQEERRKQNISLEVLEEEALTLEKALSQKFKVFADQEKAAYHSWEEISNTLVDSTAVVDIIQYRAYSVKVDSAALEQGFEDQANYVAFVILPDSTLKAVNLSDKQDFAKGFLRYTNSLKFNVADRTSFLTFWKRLDDALQTTRKVYFAPDGIYHKLNPGVFYDEQEKEYVSDKYDIVNITSGKDLLYREELKLKREAFIFGNPDFSKLSLDHELVQLPGAEREAQDITNILDIRRWKTDSYYFQNVTESNVKNLANPGVVHLATHGYFQEDPEQDNPLYSSGLYLSRSSDSGNDGLLSAYEAMNLVLDQTKIVVLAACETGLGTIKNGEGVFGLQRAFLVAGAENVLISLVKIDDNAARNFMNLFYKELRVEEDPQKAFFNARNTFKSIDTNPYNWGAYILVSKG